MLTSAALRFGIFLSVLCLMLLWEARRPFRPPRELKAVRLGRHLGLMALNFAALRLTSGAGAYGIAHLAAERGWGLLPALDLPFAVTAVGSLLLLDFAIYAQHRIFHNVPALWRLHRVHHSDLEFDTTTALRFHPLELILSMLFKMALVAALGVAPGIVLSFEAVLNACAQFNHGNVRLPRRWERRCRLLMITPDLHRIHHSSRRRETDTNFGFSVPWWDRWCGTYLDRPAQGQRGLHLGLDDLPDAHGLSFTELLRLPFRSRR